MSVPQIRMYCLFSYKTVDDVGDFNSSAISNETYYVCMLPEFQPIPANTIFYCTIAVVFIALLIGFLFCYLSIIKFIKTHGNKFSRSHTGLALSTATTTSGPPNLDPVPGKKRTEISKNRHHKTIRLIMTLILIFCVCRLPVWTFVVVTNSVKIEATTLIFSLMQFLHLLSSLSTALSPLMYTIWNKSLKTSKRGRRSRCSIRNIGTICSSSCCKGPSQRKAQLSNSRVAVFVINPSKLDRYEFASHNNSKKQLIGDSNGVGAYYWRDRSSTNH